MKILLLVAFTVFMVYNRVDVYITFAMVVLLAAIEVLIGKVSQLHAKIEILAASQVDVIEEMIELTDFLVDIVDEGVSNGKISASAPEELVKVTRAVMEKARRYVSGIKAGDTTCGISNRPQA